MLTKIKRLPPQILGTILVACSGALYGVLGLMGTQLINLHFSVTNMLFWRFFIAALWIIASNLISRRNLFFSVPNHSALLRLIFLGTIAYTISSVGYFMASHYIGTGVAMVIFFSYPIFVALFALYSGKWKMNNHTLAALIAVMIGLIMLKGQGHYALNIGGILLGLLAALAYATYVYKSHAASQFDSRLLTLLICSGNALICLSLAYLTGTFQMPTLLKEWGYIAAVGILATALPIQLMLDGLKYISPVKASILTVLEPVVTVLVGLIFLHEKVSLLQSIGVIIVLSAAILIQFEKGEEQFVHIQEGP